MSRLLVALVLALGLGAVTAVVVNANAGPHGNYDLNTNACAACHRAHTALGPDLLAAEDEYALCTSCHSSATGATTDVMNGIIVGTTNRLNGGGFEFVAGAPTTSAHRVEGLSGGTGEGTAWGSYNGDENPTYEGPGVSGVLGCTSCHNAHGSVNYRALRDEDNGYPYGPSNLPKHRWVPDNPNLGNWANDQPKATADDEPSPGVHAYSAGDNAYYWADSMNNFCAVCHGAYNTQSGSGGTPSSPYDAGDGEGAVPRYRHAVNRSYTGTPDQPLRFGWFEGVSHGTPVEGYVGFGCTTCHFAHGTAAEMTGPAAGVDPTNDSALLYYDNRGVCRSCHQKTK